jgi:hypothetical protein
MQFRCLLDVKVVIFINAIKSKFARSLNDFSNVDYTSFRCLDCVYRWRKILMIIFNGCERNFDVVLQ